MSKASRKFKRNLKQDNRDSTVFCPSIKKIPRKNMTLKSYRKQCRELNAYANGMKRHIACFKGRIK